MRWLYKLEYKYGKYSIRNLMTYIVAGMAIVYVLDQMLYFNLSNALTFYRPYIFQGQIWRLVTFIFVPPGGQPFMLLISLYCYYLLGNLLEQMWGSFKLNVYYLVGILGAIIAGFVSPLGFASNSALNSSLFLAVAALMPETEFRLFFLIPLKAKWLAAGYFLFMIPGLINSFARGSMFGFNELIVLAFSLLNFFVFFGRSLIETGKNQIRIYKNRQNWKNNTRR